MGAAHALTAGSNPDKVAVTRSIKISSVKGALDELKPLIASTVMNATGNISASTNALMDIGAMVSEPAVQVVRENKPAKLKSHLTGDKETNVEQSCPS